MNKSIEAKEKLSPASKKECPIDVGYLETLALKRDLWREELESRYLSDTRSVRENEWMNK